MNNNDSKAPKKSEPGRKIPGPETPEATQRVGNEKEPNPKGPKIESGANCDSTQSCKFFSLAASNKEQAAVYLLLVLGLIILLFFHSLFGGLIIGGVAGFCFSSTIIYYLRNLTQIITGHDQLRYVVLTGVLLGLFIEAPGIFIGALIVATFKQVFVGQDSSTK